MTELQFLLDLLLNHKLPQTTKKAVVDRIRHVELLMTNQPVATARTRANVAPTTGQSPSTQRILEEMDLEGKGMPNLAFPPIENQQQAQVTQIAQSPAAAAALAARAEAINMSLTGKIDKGQTRPRKF